MATVSQPLPEMSLATALVSFSAKMPALFITAAQNT